MNSLRKTASLMLALTALLAAILLIGAPLTGASPDDSGVWTFEVDDKKVKGNEGDVIPVATFDTPSQIIGQSCLVTVVGDNVGLPSPHPNNDIVMTSDTSSVEVKDFERHEYQETEATERLTLGATIDVAIRLGPDKKSSGGATIRLHDCQFFAFLPIVNGPSLPRGELLLNTTVYCSEENSVLGFAWAKNDSSSYWVDVNVQFSGWGFGSGRLLPGEEKTIQVKPPISSIPAGIVYISLEWENGETQTIEVPFEALDCNPADWVVYHMERDPWFWTSQFNWEVIPEWFQPPTEELQLVSIPLGRQVALRAHDHTVEFDVVEWYDQQYIIAVYVDGTEIETVTGEISEKRYYDQNGVEVLAVFVDEGCGQNLCQNPTIWSRQTEEASGLLVEIAAQQ